MKSNASRPVEEIEAMQISRQISLIDLYQFVSIHFVQILEEKKRISFRFSSVSCFLSFLYSLASFFYL